MNTCINRRYREMEKHLTLTVVSASPRDGRCQECQQRSLIFHCHCFREVAPHGGGVIADLCKPCAIRRAGGEEKLWVRTDEYLRQLWDRNRRLERGRAIACGGQGNGNEEDVKRQGARSLKRQNCQSPAVSTATG